MANHEQPHPDDGFYRLILRSAVGGIIVEKGIITKTAPYFSILKGKTIHDIHYQNFQLERITNHGKYQLEGEEPI